MTIEKESSTEVPVLLVTATEGSTERTKASAAHPDRAETDYIPVKQRPWPEAVSDGLSLPCSDCGCLPSFDWIGDDNLWERVVPKELRLGVVCLPCFALRADALHASLIGKIAQIQFIGAGVTVVCRPVFSVHHKSRRVVPERIGAVLDALKSIYRATDDEWTKQRALGVLKEELTQEQVRALDD